MYPQYNQVFEGWIWSTWRGFTLLFWISATLIQHRSGLASHLGPETWPLCEHYKRWLQFLGTHILSRPPKPCVGLYHGPCTYTVPAPCTVTIDAIHKYRSRQKLRHALSRSRMLGAAVEPETKVVSIFVPCPTKKNGVPFLAGQKYVRPCLRALPLFFFGVPEPEPAAK